MKIHQRNGGGPLEMDWKSKFLSGGLVLDSLDLAEIVVLVEREFSVKPFENSRPPRTWEDFLKAVEDGLMISSCDRPPDLMGLE